MDIVERNVLGHPKSKSDSHMKRKCGYKTVNYTKNQENAMVDYNGDIIDSKRRHTVSEVSTSVIACVGVCPTLTNISGTFDVFRLAAGLRGDKYKIKSVTSNGRKSSITAKELSQLWSISPEVAQSTIDATTQLCVRSAEHPSLS